MATTTKDILYGQNYVDQMMDRLTLHGIRYLESAAENLCTAFGWRTTPQGYRVWRERFFALGGTPQRLGYEGRPNHMDD